MILLSYLRAQPEDVVNRLKIKNFDASSLVSDILECDETRRKLQKNLDELLAEANSLAREIGNLMKQGKADEAGDAKERTARIKAQSKQMEEDLRNLEERQHGLLLQLPNLPHPTVKPGRSSDDNEIVESFGLAPVLHDTALPHWELAAKYELIDFELGSKITGAGFPVYKGKGARLQRALINFFLDEATAAGYSEIQPPLMVNEASAYGTGQLPDKDGQMYFVNEDKLYLIPTAEVPVTNIYRDLILKISDFPLKNTAYSSCFRREAGSYGKDVRGLNRLHQFDKVEIVQIQHPEKSYDTLEEMRAHVASLLGKLELPYRVLKLCGGDMSFTSALTYDFEVYSAAQKKWLEVSSVSNFESYQANRMKLRFKNDDGKMLPAHTLNGSALALPRIVAALLENNQTEGRILLPSALVPYTGFECIE